jgi:hypothetical protein
MTLKIGNAQGFWGDSGTAPARLVSQQPDLDYLTLDYLAEVSMSIMAIQREKNPELGYASDFIDVVRSLIPLWKQGAKVKIVTNAGGLNPLGCAKACAEILRDRLPMKIGVVSGDDILSLIQADVNNPLYHNLETGDSLKNIENLIVTANAYFGAKPIVEALQKGAMIVITGRTADPSLTVAPCVAHFGWSWQDYDRLAAATVAGHLIECGTQVTGGISTNWLDIQDKAHIGFPIVEMEKEGDFVITKPQGTGGVVNEETVKEQLLYELGDPDHYLSPDVIVSFLSLKLKTLGKDRIEITGAKGKAPTKTYKVSATYRAGYRCEAFLTIFGQKAAIKAKLCGEIILQKVQASGFEIQRSNIECLGNLEVIPGLFQTTEIHECVLRVAVADSRKEALECFSKEIAPMVTYGPQGVTGYTSGRPTIRKVFGYWPCLVEVEKVKPHIQYLEEKHETL